MPLFNTIRKKMLGERKLQNYWLYAAGEIILVVIGILLALQINTWNENIKKRKEAHQLIQNFHQDLTRDIDQLQNNIVRTQQRLVEIDSIFILLHHPSPQAIPDLIKYNTGITQGDLFELNSGTFNESLSSGKINYIENDSLREHIFEYYRSVNENLTQKNAYKFLIETILPEWGSIIIPTQEAMGYLGLKNSMPPLDLEALAKNKKYNTVLAQTFGNHLTLIELWQGYIRRATILKENIEKEL